MYKITEKTLNELFTYNHEKHEETIAGLFYPPLNDLDTVFNPNNHNSNQDIIRWVIDAYMVKETAFAIGATSSFHVWLSINSPYKEYGYTDYIITVRINRDKNCVHAHFLEVTHCTCYDITYKIFPDSGQILSICCDGLPIRLGEYLYFLNSLMHHKFPYKIIRNELMKYGIKIKKWKDVIHENNKCAGISYFDSYIKSTKKKLKKYKKTKNAQIVTAVTDSITAAQMILDEFENFLDEKGVVINNPEKEKCEDENTAQIYGSDYFALEDKIIKIIKENKVVKEGDKKNE
jgi:hypothetical protein